MKHQASTAPLALEVAHSKQLGMSPKKGSRKAVQKNPTVVASHHAAIMGSRDDLIRRRAYSLYEARHSTNGCDLDDWLQAEAEIDQMPTQPM